MPQSFVSLHYHLIFSTKNRVPLISAEIQPRLSEYIGGILRAEGSVLEAAGGMADHVHLLVSINKQMSISDVLRIVEASSSRWAHETFPDTLSGFAWQAGYGAFAVSYSHREKVRDYLSRQAEHHRKVTFQEGFVEFLKRHGIPMTNGISGIDGHDMPGSPLRGYWSLGTRRVLDSLSSRGLHPWL
jgi:REP element-mobilizing transposase RayT